MSARNDKLASLSHLQFPEPDAIRMQQTINAATAAFARQEKPAPSSSAATATSWLRALFYKPSNWLVPAGVGLAAMVAAVAILPTMSDGPALPVPAAEQAPAPGTVADSAPEPVPAPAPAPSAAQAPSVARESVTEMGARPPSMMRERAPIKAPTQRVAFGDLQMGVRDSSQSTEILLYEDGQEKIVYLHLKTDPGPAPIGLRDALQIKSSDRELILLEFSNEPEGRWNVFERSDRGFTRLPDLSNLIDGTRDRDQARAAVEKAITP